MVVYDFDLCDPHTTVHSLRHALFGVLSDVDSGRAFGDGVEATAETSC